VGLAPPIAVAVFLAGRTRVRNVVEVGAITAVTLLLGGLAVGWRDVFDQIVQFRASSRGVEPWSLAGNWSRFRRELAPEGFGLLALAAVGAALAVRRALGWVLLLWTALA